MACVCVPTTKHGNIVLEQRLREIFEEEWCSSSGMNNKTQ